MARRLEETLAPTAFVLSLDQFFNDNQHMDRESRRHINFDSPEAIDVTELNYALVSAESQESIRVPTYDFTQQVRSGYYAVAVAPLLVLEGNLALHLDLVRDASRLRVFLDVDDRTRLERRLDRDIRERGRDEAWVRRHWAASVLPMHHQYVNPSMRHADLILDGTSPLEELVAQVRSRLIGGDEARVG
ncbi:MAG: uridine kinase [Rhodoglobus sp.]|nr:uridine kinase [Rhodoglobus sp.]